MIIRDFRVGDEDALRAVYSSAIHDIAFKDYTPEQINAWAPHAYDQAAWIKRIRGIAPFVVEIDGKIVAYADVQSTGYIDHFFVSAGVARRGVGSALMAHIHATAAAQHIETLTSDVSRTAQPFFLKFGFSVIEQRTPVIRGVVVPNAFMRKILI